MTDRQQMVSKNGQQSADAGVTCTFVGSDGTRWTQTLAGNPSWALNELCNEALERDESMLLISYSTPDTIYSDLRGRRHSASKANQPTPEFQSLGRIGRRDMCHPSLIGEETKARRRA